MWEDLGKRHTDPGSSDLDKGVLVVVCVREVQNLVVGPDNVSSAVISPGKHGGFQLGWFGCETLLRNRHAKHPEIRALNHRPTESSAPEGSSIPLTLKTRH